MKLTIAGLELTHGEDGYWLCFDGGSKKGAVNLENTFKPNILHDAVMQWAQSQTEIGEPVLKLREVPQSNTDVVRAMCDAFYPVKEFWSKGALDQMHAAYEVARKHFVQGRYTLEQIEKAIGANTRTRQEVEKIRGMMRHESYDLAESAIEIILEGRRKRLQPAPKPSLQEQIKTVLQEAHRVSDDFDTTAGEILALVRADGRVGE
jgi:hypothetical protein